MSLRPFIEQLMVKQNLSSSECEKAVACLLTSQNIAQQAAFMVLLRAKQETAEEIVGIAKAMRAKMVRVEVETPVLDIVGTGGDGAHTVNISTGASLLAASCGVNIIKHGNRAVSSKCGAADVLAAMGC